MHTGTTMGLADTARDVENPQVTAFFEALKGEQQRYLALLGQAHTYLGADAAQLVHATAIHVRLTRRLFDAQRSIMTQRANLDARLAEIAREAGLGDIDSIFTSPDPDGAVAERQLESVLDAWWDAERTHAASAFDGAERLLSMHASLERLDADQFAVFPAPRLDNAAQLLPDELLVALDAADPLHLDALFTSLAESLTESLTESPTESPTAVAVAHTTSFGAAVHPLDEMIIRLEPLPLTSFEVFRAPDTAWQRGVVRDRAWWLVARVIFPIGLVTAALAGLMLWLG